MKKLFTAIRANEIDTVRQLVLARPELANCVAKQPPKKDDGQSPLQIALKTGHFEIADFLIDRGASLNFIEDPSCCNAWRAPVLHDAINAAVMCSRWNTNDPFRGFQVYSTKERAEQSARLLQKMLDNGADVNALDSYANSGLWRFCLQAKQILPSFLCAERRESDDRLFTEELHADLGKILRMLKTAGADSSYVKPSVGKTVLDFYCDGSLAVLLNEVFKKG